jgi:squalene-associated FAD-dependent desaturase
MGCCTHYLDFAHRTGIAAGLRRDGTLHFFGPRSSRVDVHAAPLWPAPLHLAPSLGRLRYLSRRERYRVATALLQLARQAGHAADETNSMRAWLVRHRQSPRAMDLFWAPVLVSALSETLDRMAVAAARQVFVEGFLAHRSAYEVLLPVVSLAELYDQLVPEHLSGYQVRLHRGARIRRVAADAHGRPQLVWGDGLSQVFDRVVLAVPWRQTRELLEESTVQLVPELVAASRLEPVPISAVHLWFDRPFTPLRHAVLVGRQSQWLFHRTATDEGDVTAAAGHHYQVVISASRDLAARGAADVLAIVLADLRAVWPAVADARLIRWRLITQREAVFSMSPGAASARPDQATAVPWLYLAGDWTRTGWPATMEGAVRSGYGAAHRVLTSLGLPTPPPVRELPRGCLVRWWIGQQTFAP